MKNVYQILVLMVLMMGMVGCQGMAVSAEETAVTTSTNNSQDDGQELAGQRPLATVHQNSDEQQAIDLLVAVDEVAQHLANYPDWTAEAYPDDETNGQWYIDLYSEAADEWLGYGVVDLPNAEVLEYFVPRELTPEEFQHGLALVEHFVLNDAEVLALLGDVSLWDHDTYYERWDQNWNTYFWRGIDEWRIITVLNEDDTVYLEGIIDANAFGEQEQADLNRDQAIELAYEADGLWEALENTDDWHTYVEHQGEGRYSVEFVGGGQELFYALVDIDSWQIIDKSINLTP